MAHPPASQSAVRTFARRHLRTLLVAGTVAALSAAPASAAPASAAASSSPGLFQVGMRLTWQAGDSSLEGAKLVPDPNGWLWSNNQWNRLDSSGGTGGVGFEQVTILSATNDAVVGDVRSFLSTDLQSNVNVFSGHGAVVGNTTTFGPYWVAPAQLAAQQEGFDGLTRVWRGPRDFNGQTFDTISTATMTGGSYSSNTYDVTSGVLLFGGSMDAAPGVLITDEQGSVVQRQAGAVTYHHRSFVSVRQLSIPWAASPAPEWAQPGQVRSYQGETRAELADSTGLPALPGQPIAVSQVIDQRIGEVAIGRQITQSATTQGLPPQETVVDRAFGSAMFDGMWLPPDAFSQLQPRQTLDQDPVTGQTVTFGGVEGQTAVLVTAGPGDQLEQYYDVTTGALTFSRYRVQTANVGTMVTEVALVTQG